MFILLSGCIFSPQDKISHRWDFAAIDMPNVKGFVDSIKIAYQGDDIKENMEKFFRGNELMLRKDNSYDIVAFKKYMHGAWKYDEPNNRLVLADETGQTQPVVFYVDSIGTQWLELKTDGENIRKLIPAYDFGSVGYSYLLKNSSFTLFLSRDKDVYWQEKNDPYSKVNNFWRIKPASPETKQQILDRVNNHLHFWKLIVQDAIDNDRGVISFHWFESPLVIASNGSALRNYDDVKDAWETNFYDSTQAREGYALLENCFKKGVKAGETDSHFQNDIIIIDQLIANLGR